MHELRALDVGNGNGWTATFSGYFSDLGLMAKAAAKLSGDAAGVYLTLNKGYLRDDFTEAWERYLSPSSDPPKRPNPSPPASEVSYPSQCSNDAGKTHFSNRHTTPGCDTLKSEESPVFTRVVTDVTDEKRGEGENGTEEAWADGEITAPEDPENLFSESGGTEPGTEEPCTEEDDFLWSEPGTPVAPDSATFVPLRTLWGRVPNLGRPGQAYSLRLPEGMGLINCAANSNPCWIVSGALRGTTCPRKEMTKSCDCGQGRLD